MLQNNPKQNLFGFQLPPDFFLPEIVDKYNKVIKAMGGTFDNIEDVINESIQEVRIPSLGYELIKQFDTGLQNQSLPDLQIKDLVDQNQITVVFRHTDGYLSYFCLLEHFYRLFQHARDNSVVGQSVKKPHETIKRKVDLPLILLQRNGNPIFIAIYKWVFMLSMPALTFTYATQNREYITFEVNFGFYEFSTKVDLPKIVADQYGNKK